MAKRAAKSANGAPTPTTLSRGSAEESTSSSSSTFQQFHDMQKKFQGTALAELRLGAKKTHWIWYTLPHMLPAANSAYRRAPSAMASTFAITTPALAVAYLRDDTLRANYVDCLVAIHRHLHDSNLQHTWRNADKTGHPNVNAVTLMGSVVDVEKLYMSLSTFTLALYQDPSLRVLLPCAAADLRGVGDSNEVAVPAAAADTGAPPIVLPTIVEQTMTALLLNINFALSPVPPQLLSNIPSDWHGLDVAHHVITALLDWVKACKARKPGDASGMLLHTIIVGLGCHMGVRSAWDASGGVSPPDLPP